MQKLRLLLVCSAVLAGTLVPLAGSSGGPSPDVLEAVATFDYSDNMIPTGYSPREIPIDNDLPGAGSFNSDLAFWGKTAIQGSYAGFRIIDVKNPRKPKEIINYEECFSRFNSAGNQGDITIWGDILMRSWNSGADEGDTCDGEPVPEDTEGVHVFDISDPTDPDVVAYVPTRAGRTRRRWCPISPTTGSSSTRTRRAARSSGRTRGPSSRSRAVASTSSRCPSPTRRPPRTCASRLPVTRRCRPKSTIRATTPR